MLITLVFCKLLDPDITGHLSHREHQKTARSGKTDISHRGL
jgi:hypothetical protein